MKWRRQAELLVAFGVPTLGFAIYLFTLTPRLLDNGYYVAVSVAVWVPLALAAIATIAGLWWRNRRR